MLEKKNEKVRIVIEFHGDFQRDWAGNEIRNVKQVFVSRNPLTEPYITTEVSKDDGKTWQIIDAI
jgi:hypothetical protein